MKFQHRLQEPPFRVKNIDIQKIIRHKNFTHHFRNGRIKHGFIYVVSGKMGIYLQSEDVQDLFIHPGELVFIPKNTVYSGKYMEENTEIRIVQFDIEEGELPEHLSYPVKIELPSAGELMESLFRPMENELFRHPFYYLSLAYELLWRIEENHSPLPKKYRNIQPAILEISERYFENEKISYYANLCGMSEVNFRRLFGEYTGSSPTKYRNEVRLKNAKFMLESGEYNVSETAEKCGFTNLSFFIRLFKKKYGHTPKKQ